MSDKTYIPVRLSHLLRHSSVGAIVRGPDFLMTVRDIREWKQKDGSVAGRVIPYVEQVKSALDIAQELREPPTASVSDSGKVDGAWIPAQRFPAWMKCPSCHYLYYQPWRDGDNSSLPRCIHDDCKKKSELEQVPWILIHKSGHMADLYWHGLTHTRSETRGANQCAQDSRESYLRLVPRQGGGWNLHCKRCAAHIEFNDSAHLPFGNAWRQPWLRESPDTDDDGLGVVVEINDARVHSSLVRSALVIPPESRIRKGSIVDRLYASSDKRRKISQAKPGFPRKQVLAEIAREFHSTRADIERALAEIDNGYPLYGANITQGLLMESEYEALIQDIPDVVDDEDFVTTHMTGGWGTLAEGLPSHSRAAKVLLAVDRVIAVNRLKEIMVLMGFQRMGGEMVPPDIVGESDWLPALELYGEGLFFTLGESVLQRWESHPLLLERARDFERRYEAAGLSFEPEIAINPRFILLHTISHMLIRELESEAGYPAASIKERIYCAKGGKVPMSGILIYVAVPDVVGSLGGLAELAEPRRFLRLLTRVFDHADWCSLDPVCSEHEGQGPSLLNRAACHACALVPEPSCTYGNTLLDRIFLKGSKDEGIPTFLDSTEVEG